MRHPVIIIIASLLIAALFYIIVYSLFNDNRAATGTLTISGLTSLILFSAYDSKELNKSA